MPRYTLIDYQGEVIDVVEAPSFAEAERGAHARGQRGALARSHRAGDDAALGVSARNDAPDLVAIAEARLAEAFSRLGLTDRQAEQAVLGRDASPLERARVDRLREVREGLLSGEPGQGGRAPAHEPGLGATADPPRASGRYVGGRKIPDGFRSVVVRDGERSGPRRPRNQLETDSGIGWDQVTPKLRREAQTQTAETAGALIRAGYDPNDVSAALGLPLRHTGAAPVTVQATETPAPVVASEAARRLDRGEDVQLREVTATEDRIGAALGRAFGLSDAERDHASRGR